MSIGRPLFVDNEENQVDISQDRDAEYATEVPTTGTIFYKSVQLLAYADVIDIIARSRTALKEAFYHLKE